jgi:PAS domain S-box-containing protein
MQHNIFEARPGLALLLLPDPPNFTVVAVSEDFIKITGLRREDLVGKSALEVFPESSRTQGFSGPENLQASFQHVIHSKEAHTIPLQRYMMPEGDGSFSERYWRCLSVPVLSTAGDLEYIILSAEDLTLQFKMEEKADSLTSIEKSYDFFMSAPVIIGLLRGDDYVIEMANEGLLEVWGRTTEVIGKPLLTALPELANQGFVPILDKVRSTGEAFYAHEFPITLMREGKAEDLYFDFVYKPFYGPGANSTASGIISVGHDVTAQVLAKKTILESDEKYRSLFESIDQGFCIIEIIFDDNQIPYDYRFLEINPAFEKQSGLSNAAGKTILEMAPDFEDFWPKTYGKVALTGEPARLIDESKALERWFDVYAFRVGGPGSRQVAAFFTDITDQKKSEQKVRESEERFRNLADDSPLFIFIVDPLEDARMSYWNRTWLQYTGQSMEEALGRAWDGIIHPDDVPGVMEIYVPAFRKMEPYFIPAVRAKRYDGEYRWHAFKGNPRYLPNGDFNGYVGVGFDIHDQKLAEDALKQSEIELQHRVVQRTLELENQKNLFDNILKNSSNGITVSEMIRDENGKIMNARIIMANDAAVNYIGLPKEVFLSKTALELDPKILHTEYAKTCLRTLETGEPALSQYYLEITRRWQELTISKMDDDHLIHIFTDVTPIKEAQLQLEQTVVELKRSNTNLEEFAYAASHDLKEPVRKIRVFSDRLKNRLHGLLEEQDRNFFTRMEMATIRMNTLIDDLLEYSYVSKGALLEHMVDLNKVLAVVLEDLDMEIEQKNATVHVEELPTIRGHERQLQQLLQNLVGNSLKYCMTGQYPVINISSRKVVGNDPLLKGTGNRGKGEFHLVEIKDNGIGFVQADADRIFNVFTRLHGNAEYKGSGVGLSIVRKVVENHRGQIWAEGKPGEGAVFKLLLPES